VDFEFSVDAGEVNLHSVGAVVGGGGYFGDSPMLGEGLKDFPFGGCE